MAGYSDDEFGIPGIPSGKTTGSPSKTPPIKSNPETPPALAYPHFFPGQGGLPIQVDDDERNGFTLSETRCCDSYALILLNSLDRSLRRRGKRPSVSFRRGHTWLRGPAVSTSRPYISE
jgi:hypothetical protein